MVLVDSLMCSKIGWLSVHNGGGGCELSRVRVVVIFAVGSVLLPVVGGPVDVSRSRSTES